MRWRTSVAAAALLMMSSGLAHADSGIRLGSLRAVDGTLCPACGESQTAVFALDIKNTNSGFLACTEEVKINKEDIRACEPTGTCSFVGFGRSPDLGSMNNTNLTFEVDDDSAETIYFAIETGPNSQDCDFLEVEIDIAVCDIGGPCVWDAFDRPCEPPTMLRKTVRVKTEEATCPTSEVGTATVAGYVYDADGDPLRHARVTLERGCVSSDSYVRLTETTESTNAGSHSIGYYEFINVPQALGYELSVTEDGVTSRVSLDITSDSVSQDLSF